MRASCSKIVIMRANLRGSATEYGPRDRRVGDFLNESGTSHSRFVVNVKILSVERVAEQAARLFHPNFPGTCEPRGIAWLAGLLFDMELQRDDRLDLFVDGCRVVLAAIGDVRRID